MWFNFTDLGIKQLITAQYSRRTGDVSVISILVLAGCANVPYIAGANHVPKNSNEVVTGSNLVRKGRPNSVVLEVDKDALKSAKRGSGAIRANGK